MNNKNSRKNNSIDGFNPTRSVRQPRRNRAKTSETINNKKQFRGDGFNNDISINKNRQRVVDLAPKRIEKPMIKNPAVETKKLKEVRRPELLPALTNGSKIKKKSGKRGLIKKIILVIVALILTAATIWFYTIGSQFLKASNNILQGSWSGFFKKSELKQDSQSRTNFLVFGTASNDPEDEHGGALLTDSIVVVSYNNTSKQAAIISVPRDLWVKLDNRCFVGDYAKINTVYQCGSNNGQGESAGATALGKKMTEIMGLDIHYSVHLNFESLIQIVDSLGGVEITIASSDPRGIYDPNFDWKCNRQCNYVRYPNGPTGLMDGLHTLYLIRARNAMGGYGLARSNFDREDNQRKVLVALTKKVLDMGLFTDINKITELISILGDNLRTNIKTDEVQSVLDVVKNTSHQFDALEDQIESISLIDVTTTGQISGQSVVIPKSGVGRYDQIKKHINKKITQDPIVKEQPSITVLNASDAIGIARRLADQLENEYWTIKSVGNSDSKITGKGLIYRRNNEKSKSFEILKAKFNLEEAEDSSLMDKYNSDFLVMVGSDLEL